MFESKAAPESGPVERVETALAELRVEDRSGWSGTDRSVRVRQLLELAERAHAEAMRAVADWDRDAAWAEDGAPSAVAWLVSRAPVTRVEAARIVRSARLLREHPETAHALAAGEVKSGHVETIATAARDREDLYAEHEHALVADARGLSVHAFTQLARHWRRLVDDHLGSADAAEAFERRYLHVSTTFGGQVVIEGQLDPEGGAVLCAALGALEHAEPAGAVAPRTASQRRADALVELASQWLGGASPGTLAGRRSVGVDVVIDLDTLLADPRRADEQAVFWRPSDDRVRCELDGVGPVATEVARRLACDAAVGRVVMRGRSEVPDVGRRTRVVSTGQRRALVHRDHGCVFPDCGRPHQWTDAHHLVHWADGGATDLANLALLCRRHHVMCHEGGWSLAARSRRTVDRSPGGTP